MSDPTSGWSVRGHRPWSRRLTEFLRTPETHHRRGTTEGTALWRMRTTVQDRPGSLAGLCAALARRGIDILTLQTHPLADGTVDEFLLRAPAPLRAHDLLMAVSRSGGTDSWVERADAHDLVDAPTRALGLAIRAALDPAELPLALRSLLGRCTISSVPSGTTLSHTGLSHASASQTAHAAPDSVLEGRSMRLPDADGGTLSVERPHLPFTPGEFARARALVTLGTCVDARMSRDREGSPREQVGPPPTGGFGFTIREADEDERAAALALHERCSDRTLGLRYHGPVADADRYLSHLLSPRFGRTLGAYTGTGRLIGLGHLLGDGEEAEAALLVEDAWQRRGIGSALLSRLAALAVTAGYDDMYAVTQPTNKGMIAAMRGLCLPLHYQVEDATLVITATLDRTVPHPPPPYGDHSLLEQEQAER